MPGWRSRIKEVIAKSIFGFNGLCASHRLYSRIAWPSIRALWFSGPLLFLPNLFLRRRGSMWQLTRSGFSWWNLTVSRHRFLETQRKRAHAAEIWWGEKYNSPLAVVQKSVFQRVVSYATRITLVNRCVSKVATVDVFKLNIDAFSKA